MKDDVITSMYAGNVEVRLIRDGSVRIVITDYDATDYDTSGGYVNGYEVEEFCKSYMECMSELRVINALKALFDIGGRLESDEFDAVTKIFSPYRPALSYGGGNWSERYGEFIVTYLVNPQWDIYGKKLMVPTLIIVHTESKDSIMYEESGDGMWGLASDSASMRQRRINNDGYNSEVGDN